MGSIWKTPVLNFIQSWITHAPLVFGRPGAGPAVMLSFVVAAIACGFAALCYAELAAMIPISGGGELIDRLSVLLLNFVMYKRQ
jgi:APA family basic amino acid/polyamine antiporter